MSGTVKLRPYQAQILDELKHLSAIGLFMGTGTGKTITSLVRATSNPTTKLLIVCPHNVLQQWERVITANFGHFQPLKMKKSWSATRKDEEILNNKKYNTVIVNFEILDKLENLLSLVDEEWTIIIDESHRIKTLYKTLSTDSGVVRATAAAIKLGAKTPWKIILTATPTQKEFGGFFDYYPQLAFLGYISPDMSEFLKRYCVIQKVAIPGVRWPVPKIMGYRNYDEIEHLLKSTCRRYISKVGDYEPQHIKITLPRTKSFARTARTRAYQEIALLSAGSKRVALKTLCTGTIMGYDFYKEPKTYHDNTIKLDWLEDFLKDTDERVAVFYQYNVERDNLIALMKKLGKKYITINGETKDSYSEINDKNWDVMLGQYQTASQSLDGMQFKCHIEVFFALPESSIHHVQTLGRIDRDGQKQVPTYYYLVMENTVEEDIFDMTQSKVEFSEATLDKLLIKYEPKEEED